MLFDGVEYAISLSLPAERQDHLMKMLNENGASRATNLEEATHVVTDSINFEGKEKVKEEAFVITGQWVDRSMLHGKQQDPKLFSADPNMIFSGVIACADNLEICDKEVIAAGINALGGLYREGYTRDCTHLLTPRPGSDKYKAAMHFKNVTRVRVVLPHWFDDCFKHFTRLDEAVYEWPDPPLLSDAKPAIGKVKLPFRTKEVVKADEAAEGMQVRNARADIDANKEYGNDTKVKKENVGTVLLTRHGDVWNGRSILLSASLHLQPGRREAVEVSIRRAGGEIVESSGKEADDVDVADIYIIQHRKGRAFLNALLKNKTIGTLSWLFNVHSTGVISRPEDQLLHYPTWTKPIEKFREHKITTTNYEGNARKYVKKLIEFMGGEFTPQMTSANTIVVAAFMGGQKTTKAREWNIPIVNHTWLEDCFVEWSHVTPAQLRYVSFPENVNFGSMVGQRGVRLMSTKEVEELRGECEAEERREAEKLEARKSEATNLDMDPSQARSEPSQDVRTPSKNLMNDRLVTHEETSSPSKFVNNRQPKGKAKAKADAVAEDPGRWAEGKSSDTGKGVKEPLRHRVRDDVARLFEDELGGEGDEILILDHEDNGPPVLPRQNGSLDDRTSSKPKSSSIYNVSSPLSKKAKSVNGNSIKTVLNLVKPPAVKEEEEEEERERVASGDESNIGAGAKRKGKKKGKVGEMNASPAKKREHRRHSSQYQHVTQNAAKGKESDTFHDEDDDDSDDYATSHKTASTTKFQEKMASSSKAKPTNRIRAVGIEVEIITPRKNVAAAKSKMTRRIAVSRDDTSSCAEEEKEREEDGGFSDEGSDRAQSQKKAAGKDGQMCKNRRVIHSAAASQSGSVKNIEPDTRNAASPHRASAGQYREASVRRSSLPSPIVVRADSGIAEDAGEARRTPSRRQAAARASARLHEIAPDILQFQKDLKRGTVRGPWETVEDKMPVRETEMRRKRRISDVTKLADNDEDVEIEMVSRGAKKTKLEKMNSSGYTDKVREKTTAASVLVKKSYTSDVTRPKEDEVEAEDSEIRMLTTQVELKPQVMKVLQKLGVKMANKPSECNLLVAAAINRTEKFLCSMATVEHIVNENWALDSANAKQILPPEDYPLLDSQGELKHKFRLADAINRSRTARKKLLSGHTFYFTKFAEQAEKFPIYKSIIMSAGGKVAKTPTVRTLENQRCRHVISIPEDKAIWKPLAKGGFAIYVPELILAGILTQQMQWSSRDYRLDDNVI